MRVGQSGEFCRECALDFYSFTGVNCIACPYGEGSTAPHTHVLSGLVHFQHRSMQVTATTATVAWGAAYTQDMLNAAQDYLTVKLDYSIMLLVLYCSLRNM